MDLKITSNFSPLKQKWGFSLYQAVNVREGLSMWGCGCPGVMFHRQGQGWHHVIHAMARPINLYKSAWQVMPDTHTHTLAYTCHKKATLRAH